MLIDDSEIITKFIGSLQGRTIISINGDRSATIKITIPRSEIAAASRLIGSAEEESIEFIARRTKG